jgi:hypothetical protein
MFCTNGKSHPYWQAELVSHCMSLHKVALPQVLRMSQQSSSDMFDRLLLQVPVENANTSMLSNLLAL